jgi:hypothetical protein
MFIWWNSPLSITCNTPTWVQRQLASGIHPYSLVSDRVLSSFHTSTESIAQSTWVNIHTAQYCSLIIGTAPYWTLHCVHAWLHMLFIALISFVAPSTVPNWRVLTNINILTGFIQFILSLSARTNKKFPILYVTAQYCSMLIFTACQDILVPCLLPTSTSAFCSFSTFQYYSLLVCIVNIGILNDLNELFTAGFCTDSILTVTAWSNLTEGNWNGIGGWDFTDG